MSERQRVDLHLLGLDHFQQGGTCHLCLTIHHQRRLGQVGNFLGCRLIHHHCLEVLKHDGLLSSSGIGESSTVVLGSSWTVLALTTTALLIDGTSDEMICFKLFSTSSFLFFVCELDDGGLLE
jgi:hypothetical protein